VDASWVKKVEIEGGGMPGWVVMPSTISWLKSTMRRAESAAKVAP
jgi:hypothetical protein